MTSTQKKENLWLNCKMKKQRPLVILIRDGWGNRKNCFKNAICQGNTKKTDDLMLKYPNTLLKASGVDVGLPKGSMGNSEVGHMTIGSGRVITQSFSRIMNSIKDKSFFSDVAFLDAIKNTKKKNSTLHLMGLIQEAGVHSHIDYLFSLLKLCDREKVENVSIHLFTDGRDANETGSIKLIKKIIKRTKNQKFARIETISGRYFAMDRNNNWSRTKKAYEAIVLGKSKEKFADPLKFINDCYSKGKTDEFINPSCSKQYGGIKDNDSVIFFNHRTDRTRQLTKAMIENKFEGWSRKPLKIHFVAMTDYYAPMSRRAKIAFKPEFQKNTLGEVLSKKGIKQLRISETEKYAHVTFFFNDQIERPFKLEDRILIKSPDVKTYDKKPEMSAIELTEEVIKQIDKGKYRVIVMNIVNGDMVGHTGIPEACKKAVEVVDKCVDKIVQKVLEKKGELLIFADHGNVEDQTEKWKTSHTTNKVNLIFVSENSQKYVLRKGGLKDIAPTVLDLLNIKKPKEMTGKSLLVKKPFTRQPK